MTRRWTAGRVAASLAAMIALFGGVAAAVDSIDQAATSSVTAVRVQPPRPAIVIGDSAIAALRWVPGADEAIVGFDHTLDLESCRRLYFTSCYGREGRRPPTVYQALGSHGTKYKVLVVATGYNDGTQAFAESFINIVNRARSLKYTQIVWWTLRSDVDYVSPGSISNHETFAANNQVLLDLLATGDYPDVVLADWGGYSADRAEWFVTDGVHYRAVGAWAASDYLTRKMAFLEGRQCPIPEVPDEPALDPCPDPDVTGPRAQIEDLYTIGQDGVLCYEIGTNRRFECRFDSHVLRLERVLSTGMSGSDVTALQIRLQRLDLFAAGVTGTFGPETGAAVRAFQASADLPQTGVADAATLDALGFDTSAIPNG